MGRTFEDPLKRYSCSLWSVKSSTDHGIPMHLRLLSRKSRNGIIPARVDTITLTHFPSDMMTPQMGVIRDSTCCSGTPVLSLIGKCVGLNGGGP